MTFQVLNDSLSNHLVGFYLPTTDRSWIQITGYDSESNFYKATKFIKEGEDSNYEKLEDLHYNEKGDRIDSLGEQNSIDWKFTSSDEFKEEYVKFKNDMIHNCYFNLRHFYPIFNTKGDYNVLVMNCTQLFNRKTYTGIVYDKLLKLQVPNPLDTHIRKRPWYITFDAFGNLSNPFEFNSEEDSKIIHSSNIESLINP
jgi:hypothetical protein